MHALLPAKTAMKNSQKSKRKIDLQNLSMSTFEFFFILNNFLLNECFLLKLLQAVSLPSSAFESVLK